VIHDLKIDAPDWDLMIGTRLPESIRESFVRSAAGVPATTAQAWVTVSAWRQLQHQNLPLDGGESLTFVGRPLKPKQKRWIRLAANHARAVLATMGAGPKPTRDDGSGRGLVLIEAPLRRKLVEQGSPGVILVSDRYLELSELLWRFEDIHLAQAILADGLRSAAASQEAPLLAPLTEQGLAWQLIPHYLRSRWKNHVGLERWLARLSFLPQVDSLLQAPVFPFADQLFDSPWTADPLRADITRFNRPLRSGRTLFAELSDRVGERSLQAAVAAWARDEEPGSFYALLEARTGLDAVPVARSWLEDPEPLNLRLVSVERSRDEEGGHITRIRVERDSPGEETSSGGDRDSATASRPVDLSVQTRPGSRKGKIWLRWDGAQPVATWELRSAARSGAVELDPRGRVLELDEEGISRKDDNRLPAAIKVTGYGYFLAFDPSGADLEAYGALNFRPAHDNRHHLLARLYTDPQVRIGTGLSTVHYFGPRRIGTYRRHRIVASWDFEWLDTRGSDTDAPLKTGLRLSWVYENRSNYLAPTRGQRIVVSAFAGKDIALEDDPSRSLAESGYAGIDSLAITIIGLHPLHSLALRGKLGLVAAAARPQQLDLGGLAGLRGVPSDHLRGRFRASASLEWRHIFVRDLDVQLPLARLRGIQGALFVEGGLVATDLRTGPRPSEVALSIGYGLRAMVDWFGVLPASGGIEIAWSPQTPAGRIPVPGLRAAEWPSVPFQVYIVGSQSF
jgi:hypothetical protein